MPGVTPRFGLDKRDVAPVICTIHQRLLLVTNRGDSL
jgi:hypothetical protein